MTQIPMEFGLMRILGKMKLQPILLRRELALKTKMLVLKVSSKTKIKTVFLLQKENQASQIVVQIEALQCVAPSLL